MPRCASRAFDSGAPPRTSFLILPRISATPGFAARLMRISKLRSSGSPAFRSVASSRVTIVMSFWLTRLRVKNGICSPEAPVAEAAFAAPDSSARIGINPISCRRATAPCVLAASSTPSWTSPPGVTALYWKKAMALVLASHAKDFLDGREAGERLAQAVLEHGLHALGDGRGAKVAGGGVAHDERADRVAHRHHLDDADAPPVARARALRATHRLVERDLARRLEAAKAHLVDHLGERRVRLAALVAERAHQALREHAVHGGGEEVVLRAHVEQAAHGGRRVVRVHRGEHHVAGERRLHRDANGFHVADLAHHDDVRVLSHDGAKRVGE